MNQNHKMNFLVTLHVLQVRKHFICLPARIQWSFVSAPNARPTFASKRGTPVETNPRERGPTPNVSRRVTFSSETHSRTPISPVEGRSIPVRGLYGQTSTTSPQIRTHFASKLTDPNMARRDPFASGINSNQPRPKAPFHPAHRFGVSDQVIYTPCTVHRLFIYHTLERDAQDLQ